MIQAQLDLVELTPDGSQLIVTDLLDSSISLINPDAPTNTFAIALPQQGAVNQCPVGPLYAAATSINTAFVSMGSLPVPSCPAQGNVYLVNLATKAVSAVNNATCSSSSGDMDASTSGNYTVMGPPVCMFNAQSNTYTAANQGVQGGVYGMAVSGDANVIAIGNLLFDSNVNALGSVAQPIALYQAPVFSTATTTPLVESTLTLTIPSAAAGPADIVLTRSDGESYTLENGIVVQQGQPPLNSHPW